MPWHPAKTGLAVLTATAFAAGCGSGGANEPSVAEAKATLSKDCQQGKPSDKPLCDCIADKLEAAGNGAKELLLYDQLVIARQRPAAVKQAAGQCAKFDAP
jgi:hypothetical protein